MPKIDGRNMVMVLAPDKKAKAAWEKTKAGAAEAEGAEAPAAEGAPTEASATEASETSNPTPSDGDAA
jgi:hypothetical protein